MQYSLSGRFRGTLIGAMVGEMLCRLSTDTTLQSYRDHRRLNFAYARPKQSRRDILDQKQNPDWPSSVDSLGGRVAVLGVQSLIRLGRLDLDDWSKAYRSQTSTINYTCESSEQNAMNRDCTKMIIATLPIALFYHENEIKLRQNLLGLISIWQDNESSCNSVSRDGTLAVGYAIAQCLQENFNRAELIPQIITFLGEPQAQLAQDLAKVQTLLQQRAGLEQTVIKLGQDTQPSANIALAFYCFLSTLEDLRLSVIRAAQKSHQPEITSAIAGALSGAYNSIIGIPVTLRLALSRSDTKPLAAWGIKTEAEMLELCDSLVAAWSGFYNQATPSTGLTSVAAIAAPGIIRLR